MKPKYWRTWRMYGLLAGLVVALTIYFATGPLIDYFMREPPNYSQVEEGLYLGGNDIKEPPPGTKAVLNLCEVQDTYEGKVQVHEWVPIPDAPPAPSIDWLRERVKFIDEQRRAGLQTYVHCAAGVSRSAMVVVAYLMQRDGLTRDEALARIRSKRPIINPNPAFMDRLLEWEKVVCTPEAERPRQETPVVLPHPQEVPVLPKPQEAPVVLPLPEEATLLPLPQEASPPPSPLFTLDTLLYSKIEDGLYLGGYVPEPPPGTKAVLNLCEWKDSYESKVQVHKWVPIKDASPAPSIDWLREQVQFVDDQRRAGLQTYVHCQIGVSRSAMVVTAYLMRRDGLTRDVALARVRSQRPIIGPNPAFLALLLEWEKLVKDSRQDKQP